MKNERLLRNIKDLGDSGLDAHYLAYFKCFNQQLFFEAHEVLEQIWLPQRKGPNGLFYKGLIQLAGAFVHLQKGRVGPASALFKLAQSNLKTYPAIYQHLGVTNVLVIIGDWQKRLESIEPEQLLGMKKEFPKLELINA